MASNKLNAEGVLLLEQPFARVPYENYRRVFRTAQRNIEKEFGPLQSTSNDLVNRARAGTLTGDEAVKTIEGMIDRVAVLKRKLSDLNENAGQPTLDVMRERLHHLASIESMQTVAEAEFSRWADTRLDRWLVDWSLRNGKERTARRIARDKDIENLVDIDLFSDIKRVEDALARHSCTEALAWCSENKAALRKMKSTLEFELRLQEFIELARARRTIEAIAYTKKHLVPWQETHLDEIRRASGLLAFPPNTTCGPYKRLYDFSRWSNLIRSFRLAIYSLNTLPTEPLLHLALYGGLASLKLPACYDRTTKNVDCPVCDGESNAFRTTSRHEHMHPGTDTGSGPVSASDSGDAYMSGSESSSIPATSSSQPKPSGLGRLAEEVPFSHHANSTIVCRITGKIMDEDNMPLAFPNGYVYSLEAMQEMAAKNNNIVTCPRSELSCSFSELRKVFIS